jgi:Fe-S cluster assembly protein SufD
MEQLTQLEQLSKQSHAIFERQILLEDGLPVWFTEYRRKGMQVFQEIGFPGGNIESWKGTQLEKILHNNYVFSNDFEINPKFDIGKIFHCEIHNFESLFFSCYNGKYLYETHPLTTFENGIIVGSIHQALIEYPDLVKQYYGTAALLNNGLLALNAALAQDGLFVYIPDDTICETPMQLVNIIDNDKGLFTQTRNLIVLGKNSKLTFLQCDDSLLDKNSFKNSVTEVIIDESSHFEHYKLQNKDISSNLINTSFFNIAKQAHLDTSIITFNAGNIRNEIIVNLNGKQAQANLSGLYLIDKTQKVDNQILVNHNAPDCLSNQSFKGILDDDAEAIFNGHIYVAVDACKTEAYQSNKNILLTDKASIMSKPFLEIYNDDVRCSHGSTTGQLDTDALFYLQSRGICEKNARLLLMYAYADEIVRKIQVERLRKQTETMVDKRLRGELSHCEQCILHCSADDIQPYEINVNLL